IVFTEYDDYGFTKAVYFKGTPINAIDTDGKDYWSTNNPKLINQFNHLANKYNLTKDQRKQLHDYIHGEGFDYHEIEKTILDIFR
ncbi:MAG: hypothetical protein ACI4D4_09600, partial [Lachnospira sp.]